METAVKIRRLCLVEGRSISSVSRQFQLSRNTVRKYLNQVEPPRYRQQVQRASPKLDAYKARLIEWLSADTQKPKRQRRTAKLLYEGLQLEGYGGAYDSVQRFVKAWKQEAGKQSATANTAYIPLRFEAGEACQFDWSHEQVILGGCNVTIKVAHFRLCHSRKSYLRAYMRETQEMVFDAHIHAFGFYGGVPLKMIYDNPKTIVTTIYQGKQRDFNRRFLALMNHYLVEPVACTPAAGWEKGQVERQVGIMRQQLFAPRQRFADLETLNQWLEMRCQQLAERPHPDDKSRPIEAVFAEEQAALRPAANSFDGYFERAAKVHRTCVVHYDRNQYSVPCEYLGKVVSVRAYANKIVVVADEKVIAEHRRSFSRGKACFDPWHYVPILQTKPGAIRNGAPFARWALPAPLMTVKDRLLKQPGGDRDFVQLLSLIQDHGMDAIVMACELALQSGACTLAVISNHLHHLLEPGPTKPLNISDAPLLKLPPEANLNRYDQLANSAINLSNSAANASRRPA